MKGLAPASTDHLVGSGAVALNFVKHRIDLAGRVCEAGIVQGLHQLLMLADDVAEAVRRHMKRLRDDGEMLKIFEPYRIDVMPTP